MPKQFEMDFLTVDDYLIVRTDYDEVDNLYMARAASPSNTPSQKLLSTFMKKLRSASVQLVVDFLFAYYNQEGAAACAYAIRLYAAGTTGDQQNLIQKVLSVGKPTNATMLDLAKYANILDTYQAILLICVSIDWSGNSPIEYITLRVSPESEDLIVDMFFNTESLLWFAEDGTQLSQGFDEVGPNTTTRLIAYLESLE